MNSQHIAFITPYENPIKLTLELKDVDTIIGILDGSLDLATTRDCYEIAEDIHLQAYL